jgi:hypothetical protein
MVEILGKQVVKGLFWVFLFVCLFCSTEIKLREHAPSLFNFRGGGKEKKKKKQGRSLSSSMNVKDEI